MHKMNFFLEDNLFQELKKLPEGMTYHIRRAIEEYLERRFNVATSPTKKEGEKNE